MICTIIVAVLFVPLVLVFILSPILCIVSLFFRERPFAVKLYFLASPITCVEIAALLRYPVGWFFVQVASPLLGMRTYITGDGEALIFLLSLPMFYLSYKLCKIAFR